MNRALYWLVLLLVVTGSAMAKVHPVRLDQNVDSTKCLECHEDMTKGKVVHPAMSMGCLTCHEVRTNKVATHIKLITAAPVKLCLQCHADKDASQIKGRVHPPAVRRCLDCHNPHTSENDNLLLKPLSGDSKDTNLCLECHSKGLNVPAGGSRHPALDMGCNTCHVMHKTSDKGDREANFHLTKDAPALCLDCHDVTDASLIQAHDGQPFGKADCLTCHDPHQSTRPHLMQKFVHVPFDGGKDSCSTCHQPSKDGKVVLTAATPKELCLTCHSDKGEQIEKAKVQHPGAQGDCTDCHDPHAGATPDFPKPDPVNVCLTCHADQAEQGKKKYLHQPAFQQGCAVCHDPHGNDNENLLRVSNVNNLCLECHGPNVVPQQVPSEHLIAIFDGKVKLPENYMELPVHLPIKYDMGHPVDRHPVTDSRNPVDLSKSMKINCLTCHQPHSSAKPDLLVHDQANSTAFCNTCHAPKPAAQPAATSTTQPAQKADAPNPPAAQKK